MVLRIDNARATNLRRAAQVKSSQSKRQKFWSSAQRPLRSRTKEIYEISFGSPRLINVVSFQVSRFPCTLRAEWMDESGTWRTFEYALTEIGLVDNPEPSRDVISQPVGLSIAESVPAVVNTAASKGHPQHTGANHWRAESWKTKAVRSRKIRFVLQRNPRGQGPRTKTGRPVDFSLAMRKVKIGYRISTPTDVPPTQHPEDPWEISQDLLGSVVHYSVYRQGAMRAIDGSADTSWRSAAQPFNYAVVPLFLDLRDAEGDGQTVDRFYVDPITTGVHCHLYYSNDQPSGDFVGETTPIPASLREERQPVTIEPERILLGPFSPSGVAVDRTHARLDLADSWWLGLDATAIVGSDDEQVRPIVSFGPHQVVQSGGAIRFIAQDGDTAVLPLPPEHGVDTRFRLIVAHYRSRPGRDEFVRLTYQAEGFPVVIAEEAVTLPAATSGLKIGLHPDPDSPLASALAVRGLVLKPEPLDDYTVQWFLDEGEVFVRDDRRVGIEARGANRNALVRMHPIFSEPTNVFGVVGGDGDRVVRNAVWQPIARDYVLHRGYMEFPPVKARYWKFEFTQLSPRIFESFQAINRTVLVYPPDVVEQYNQVGPLKVRDSNPHGVKTMIEGPVRDLTYADVIQAAQRSRLDEATPEVTQALTISTPHLADQAAETGWIWQYQPWHTGSTSPRFSQPGRHVYERVPVRHTTKVGYFVGIRELVPHRTDVSRQDDTEEYVERFFDGTHVDSMTAMDLLPEGGLASTALEARATSTVMGSFLDVRGVQFASVETGPVQVLDDPDFVNPDLSYYFRDMGDASTEWREPNLVEVIRGWSGRTYSDLEGYTYLDLEDFSYGEMEGLLKNATSAEGGIETTKPYQPMGAGRVVAKVQVSTPRPLAAPVRVDIIKHSTGEVLGSARKSIPPGATVEVSASFAGESLSDYFTWGDLEYLPVYGSPPGEPAEVGPGTTSSATPRLIPGRSLSTNYDFVYQGTASMLYYRLDPAESGQLSIDTLLTEVNGGIPTGFFATITIDSGLSNAATTTDAEGRQRVIGDVEANVPVLFRVQSAVWNGTTYVPTSGSTTLRVRTSEVGDTTLWSPNLTVPPITEATYERLEGYTYDELERQDGLTSAVRVRVRQTGESSDVFRIHRIALYDEPIVWSFSADGGTTWHQALGIKDDPNGVLLFDQPGNELRWRADVYYPGATISALHIRPWYGRSARAAHAFFDLEQAGPNQSGWDSYPTLGQHPMWKDKGPLEIDPKRFTEAAPYWRNLVTNPSAEGASMTQWSVTGGTITSYEPPEV